MKKAEVPRKPKRSCLDRPHRSRHGDDGEVTRRLLETLSGLPTTSREPRRSAVRSVSTPPEPHEKEEGPFTFQATLTDSFRFPNARQGERDEVPCGDAE